MDELTVPEKKRLRALASPGQIQDFLDRLPFNHEERGETHMSVRKVLREKKAHCIEGALLAAAALEQRGEPPLLMDLRAKRPDDDHVVALYRRNGYWGAISKTNHAVLRFRDPVYKTLRELALSYFHEWHWGPRGAKTLLSYSDPLDLRKIKEMWRTSESDLWSLDKKLDALTHHDLIPPKNRKFIRPVSAIERALVNLVEYPKKKRGR